MASALNSGPRGRVFALIKLYALYIPFLYRGVAQFGSALGSGPRGRVFESRRLDQKTRHH